MKKITRKINYIVKNNSEVVAIISVIAFVIYGLLPR